MRNKIERTNQIVWREDKFSQNDQEILDNKLEHANKTPKGVSAIVLIKRIMFLKEGENTEHNCQIGVFKVREWYWGMSNNSEKSRLIMSMTGTWGTNLFVGIWTDNKSNTI